MVIFLSRVTFQNKSLKSLYRVSEFQPIYFLTQVSPLEVSHLGILTQLMFLFQSLLDDDRVLMNDYLELFMKELPWLGNHLGSEAITRLNQLLYECLESCKSGEDESR